MSLLGWLVISGLVVGEAVLMWAVLELARSTQRLLEHEIDRLTEELKRLP